MLLVLFLKINNNYVKLGFGTFMVGSTTTNMVVTFSKYLGRLLIHKYWKEN
jgi:hypothetical protein